MYAPPSWGLARQEHARSPKIRHCKWSFMSGLLSKKNVTKNCGGSKKERDGVPVESTPFVPHVSKKQSCIDLSANAQPNKRTAIAPSIKDSSDPGPDHSDNGSTKRVTSKSKPAIGQSVTPMSTSAISTTPKDEQPALPQRPHRAQTSASTKEHTPNLPTSPETPVRIYRQTKTLTLDSNYQPTFKIIRRETSIPALPFNQQNAAYNQALTKILLTKHTLSQDRCATLRSDLAEKVLSHYHLHLSRLAFTRLTIKSLALQHRRSARLAYRSAMSSWVTGLLQDPHCKPDITALATFRQRAAHEREERGIMALLERCELVLVNLDKRFKAVDWHPKARKASRWKEGTNGWVGLDVDDGQLRRDWQDGKGEREVRLEL